MTRYNLKPSRSPGPLTIRRAGGGHRIYGVAETIQADDYIVRVGPGVAHCTLCDRQIGSDRKSQNTHRGTQLHQRRLAERRAK